MSRVMDAWQVLPPAAEPPANPPSVSVPSSPTAWPRSARFTVGVLVGACILLLFGQSFLTSFGARPTPSPAPRVELNSASHADLMLLPGIGDHLAARIVQRRADLGSFRKIEDLLKVTGIGSIRFERIRDLVYIDPPEYASPREAVGVAVVEKSTRSDSKLKKLGIGSEPIDINSASKNELQMLPGIGPKKSQAIIDERTKRPFASISEIRRVPGIGPKTFENIKPFVTVK